MSLAELRPAAAPGGVPTAEDLIGRARKLAPKLRERALKAERDRQIPLESVAEYIDAGLIHALQPKRWGGYEHDHEVAFDIAIELGKSTCGSSAWCLHAGAVSRGSAARCVERKQSRLHRDVGGADRHHHRRARRLSSRWPLVLVLGLAALAMDHDRRPGVPSRRRSPRHAALPHAGV